MKLHVGPIPPGNDFDPAAAGSPWRRLAEPSPTRFALQAIVLSGPLVALSVVLLFGSAETLRADPPMLVAFLLFLAAMIPVHELIHGLAFPGSLASPDMVFGIWLSRGVCYVAYDAPVPRDRLLLVLAMPFIVFTTTLIGLVPVVDPPRRPILALMFTIHTATCVGDWLTFLRVAKQVPRNTQLRNHGWHTWWCASNAATRNP